MRDLVDVCRQQFTVKPQIIRVLGAQFFLGEALLLKARLVVQRADGPRELAGVLTYEIRDRLAGEKRVYARTQILEILTAA